MRTYNVVEKRAVNQIWTASGEYHFEPLFLAIHKRSGIPNFYMNLVVGLTYKYYGEDVVNQLFDYWRGDMHQSMLDDLTWLMLEDIVYVKEIVQRPVLHELREQYAKNFFASEYRLSRQEWMSKNQLVYTMQVSHYSRILNRKQPVMTIREKQLSDAMNIQEDIEQSMLVHTILDIFKRYDLFDGNKHEKHPHVFHLHGIFAYIMTHFMPTQLVKTDRVVVMRSSQIDEEGEGFLQSKNASNIVLKQHESDRTYIEKCFGRSIYSNKKLQLLEKQICTGNHFGCHVWITDGVKDDTEKITAEEKYLRDQAALQEKRNREYYYKNIALHKSMIYKLKNEIENSLLIHQEKNAIVGRSGTLDKRRVYRAVYANDDRIFLRSEEETSPLFSVDLVLDASASRLSFQEVIASQGYVLSESLKACHIPVRISEFNSLRGYTVLRILKSFQEKRSESVFQYFASGWNRDGLMLKEIGDLLEEEHGDAKEHLVIILTDASPNDSFRIHASKDNPLGCNYEDDAGVKDAAKEVRNLKKIGIRVGAILFGSHDASKEARIIYENEYVRMKSVDQLANAAGFLIRKEVASINV